MTLYVFTDVDYAWYVHHGTAPHTIRGNPYLAFSWKGQNVVFRSVWHPGTAPRPFLKVAARQTR